MSGLGVLELVIFLALIVALGYGVARSHGVVRVLAVLALGWVCVTFLVVVLIDL